MAHVENTVADVYYCRVVNVCSGPQMQSFELTRIDSMKSCDPSQYIRHKCRGCVGIHTKSLKKKGKERFEVGKFYILEKIKRD